MKKISGLTLGLGVLAAAFFALIPNNNTFAKVTIGGTEVKTTSSNGIKYSSSTHTITLTGYDGGKSLIIDETEPVTIKATSGNNRFADITSNGNISFEVTGSETSIFVDTEITTTGIISYKNTCVDKKLSADGKSFTSGTITFTAGTCNSPAPTTTTKPKEDVENPDTFDAIYVYVAVLVASSAILGYRRYLAKR